MKKQRVDIELDAETLKWAGIEAAKLGISRRKFIQNVFSRIGFLSTELPGRLEFIHTYPGGNTVIPSSFDNPFVEYGDEDLKFIPSSVQRLKIWGIKDKAQQQPKCSSNE